MERSFLMFFFFFFNDTATTEIYTLSLHDALPIFIATMDDAGTELENGSLLIDGGVIRSEEHTSELQSLAYLVCRLLLEKKKKISHLAALPAQPHLDTVLLLYTSPRLKITRSVSDG